jgi:hypothetical protein
VQTWRAWQVRTLCIPNLRFAAIECALYVQVPGAFAHVNQLKNFFLPLSVLALEK